MWDSQGRQRDKYYSITVEALELYRPGCMLTSLLIELRPTSFILPFLNELLDRSHCDSRHLGLKACDFLDLLVRQSKLVLAQ